MLELWVGGMFDTCVMDHLICEMRVVEGRYINLILSSDPRVHMKRSGERQIESPLGGLALRFMEKNEGWALW